MTVKQKIYQQFQQQLSGKINNLQLQLNDLKESTANETKSTAGDKYETARAMLQIEQDAIRRQLQELLEQQAVFSSINGSTHSIKIIQGSLIKTNRGWFLLSAALGKTTIDNIVITALSSQSPLGKLLLNKTINSAVTVNSISYTIEEIL